MTVAAEFVMFMFITMAIPFGGNWATRRFTGKQLPHLLVQWATLCVVSFGILYGVLHGVHLEDFGAPLGLVSMAWVAGSVLSALIALQEFQSHRAAPH